MPRCCPTDAIPDEYRPCYASVLMHGNDPASLQRAVEELERQDITSCFTARCPSCNRNYFLTPDLALFSTPAAHHTHKLALLALLRGEGVYLSLPADSGSI